MKYSATVLNGVMCQISQADNVSKSGLTDADAVSLFIPFGVEAHDISGEERRFVPPREFDTAQNKARLWTLKSGGKSNSAECFFIKGTVIEENSYSYMKSHYDDVYTVTKVDIRDFGRASMQHWQVSGR